MRSIVFVCLLSFAAFAAMGRNTRKPDNVDVVYTDTIYVDSTEVEYSDIFWAPDGGDMVLLIETNDTNSAGFASDSAAAKLELYGAYNYNSSNVWLKLEKAISDSLNITAMDTTGVRTRSVLPLYKLTGAGNRYDTLGYYASDVIGSSATSPGAFARYHFANDGNSDTLFAPGYVVKLTGKANNAKRGAGSRWILKWMQTIGLPVKGK